MTIELQADDIRQAVKKGTARLHERLHRGATESERTSYLLGVSEGVFFGVFHGETRKE